MDLSIWKIVGFLIGTMIGVPVGLFLFRKFNEPLQNFVERLTGLDKYNWWNLIIIIFIVIIVFSVVTIGLIYIIRIIF